EEPRRTCRDRVEELDPMFGVVAVGVSGEVSDERLVAAMQPRGFDPLDLSHQTRVRLVELVQDIARGTRRRGARHNRVEFVSLHRLLFGAAFTQLCESRGGAVLPGADVGDHLLEGPARARWLLETAFTE